MVLPLLLGRAKSIAALESSGLENDKYVFSCCSARMLLKIDPIIRGSYSIGTTRSHCNCCAYLMHVKVLVEGASVPVSKRWKDADGFVLGSQVC